MISFDMKLRAGLLVFAGASVAVASLGLMHVGPLEALGGAFEL